VVHNFANKNYYEILGIPTDSDIPKVKSAYRKLVRKYHPDVNKQDANAAEKFKQITEAYDILSNPETKAKYDYVNGYNQNKKQSFGGAKRYEDLDKAYKFSEEMEARRQRREAKKSQREENRPQEDNKKSSFKEVFDSFMDGIFTGDVQPKKTKVKAINGENITSTITITQAEAIMGTNRMVNILHTENCPKCNGKKFINGAICPLCKGSGETSIHKKINVKIPANIKDKSKIRIANEGNLGKYGGKNGDLYLIIDIEKTSKYKFEGNNTITEISILPHEGVLGAEIEVETPNDFVKMKIPPNTTSGQKFRLTGQGVKNSKGENVDLIVVVNIEIPQNLSDEEKKLYEQLQNLSNRKKNDK